MTKNTLFSVITIVILLALGIFIFVRYLNFIFHPYCFNLGYTLCAAIGEDFYALYQATSNFFHNNFIYGELAQIDLVTPYFMIFKYFPIGPLLIGWPFLLIKNNPNAAYRFYLFISTFIHFFSLYFIYLINKKFSGSRLRFVLVLFIWLSFFPLLSEWRMGQFNHLAGLFLLISITGVVYNKYLIPALSWIISLAIKPIGILTFPWAVKTKNKLAIFLFLSLFIGFTVLYLLYHQIYYPQAIKDFVNIIFLGGNRLGWQIHYIDNFSVNSFLGEIFFDSFKSSWKIISSLYSFLIGGVYCFITYRYLKTKVNNDKEKEEKKLDIYYLIFGLATLILFHKEVWESWLTLWLPITAVLILLSKKLKEITFILINTLFLSTPTLFYFYDIYKTPIWRFFLITEKVIPQILLYGFICFKLKKLLSKPSTFCQD